MSNTLINDIATLFDVSPMQLHVQRPSVVKLNINEVRDNISPSHYIDLANPKKV